MTEHDPFSAGAVRAAYDAAAADYVREFGDDLAALPLDRAMLDAAWDAAGGGGWALEAGCGPAPAADYLAGRADRVVGLDLSATMLATARRRVPHVRPVQADLRRVPLRDRSCSLVVAYYTLQHVPRTDLAPALAELRRVLAAGGVLVAATHLGEGDVVVEEFLGHVDHPFAGALHGRDEFVRALDAAGFRVEEEQTRGPLPHEYASQRLYVLCRAA
jgi:ubiquinone/menaquinone biosynthesis C-methylase UbiE